MEGETVARCICVRVALEAQGVACTHLCEKHLGALIVRQLEVIHANEIDRQRRVLVVSEPRPAPGQRDLLQTKNQRHVALSEIKPSQTTLPVDRRDNVPAL